MKEWIQQVSIALLLVKKSGVMIHKKASYYYWTNRLVECVGRRQTCTVTR